MYNVVNLITYGLGLIIAGLLPIKDRRAYRSIYAALALLWIWQVCATPSMNAGWAAASILEALLFLIFGTAAAWCELCARKGFWTVLGTSFIVCSLAIALLNRFLSASEAVPPFPFVLFTCGVLFFVVESRVVLFFLIPLGWALLGGPDSSLAAQAMVTVALLASAFFLVTPFQARQASGVGRPVPEAAYRVAHSRRTWFGYGLWALILTTLLLSFWSSDEPFAKVLIRLALLSVLGIMLWLAFPAWQSLWYRAVAWWVARAIGRLWLGAKFALRWSILLLAAAALWSWLHKPEDTKPKDTTSTSAVTWYRTLEVRWQQFEAENRSIHLFFMALFLWIAYHAYRGRKRLVIGTFSGHGDENLEKGLAAGLGTRLQSELARIADVYKVIDEMTPSVGQPVIEVTPGVLEVGEILKEASAISFGPLKVPANLFTGLVGNIVSGPRLTGALHKVEDQFILTAEVSGGGFSSNWRVDYSDFSEEEKKLPPGAAIQKLVEQLAFRVATDLVCIGSPRWRAVRCYTEGLRSYREAERQQRNKKLKLRDSERGLIRALNDDQRFTQCHYNLGVIYRQLGEISSAQAAFRRALAEHPDNFEACYALAEALSGNRKYAECKWFCKAAIGIEPVDARAWALEAYACLQDYKRRHKEEEARKKGRVRPDPSPSLDPEGFFPPPGNPFRKEIQELSEISVALAWRALCRRALTGKSLALQREKATAFTCTRNLAVILTRCDRFSESRQVFRQAAWLKPNHPDLRLYEGRTLFWDGALDDAAAVLEGVFADAMDETDRSLLWSVLRQVEIRSGEIDKHRDGLRIAHRRYLDVLATLKVDKLPEMIELSLEPPKSPTSVEEERA